MSRAHDKDSALSAFAAAVSVMEVGGGTAGDVGVACEDAHVISAQEALTKLNSLRSDEAPAVYEPLHARCPVYAAPVAMMQNNCFQ